MLTLNLLPKKLKQQIKLSHIYGILKRINYVLLSVAVFFSIIMLISMFVLKNNLGDIVEQTTLTAESSQVYTNKIIDINSRLNSIAKAQDNFTEWSYLIEDLSKNTKDGIEFSLIKISKEDNEITLRGKADFRDDLLALKKYLDDSSYFTEVDFPIKNILKKENIDFEIKANLQYESK